MIMAPHRLHIARDMAPVQAAREEEEDLLQKRALPRHGQRFWKFAHQLPTRRRLHGRDKVDSAACKCISGQIYFLTAPSVHALFFRGLFSKSQTWWPNLRPQLCAQLTSVILSGVLEEGHMGFSKRCYDQSLSRPWSPGNS